MRQRFRSCVSVSGILIGLVCLPALDHLADSTPHPIVSTHRSMTSSETATGWPLVCSVPAVRAVYDWLLTARATRPLQLTRHTAVGASGGTIKRVSDAGLRNRSAPDRRSSDIRAPSFTL